MGGMSGKQQAQLGAVQETLFITLAARAKETGKKRPVLRDPKARDMVSSVDFDAVKYGRGAGTITVMRTAILDEWVRVFLDRHPAGTVVEIGTGLNTRFDRVDNGSVHWIDLDLPDTIELRRRFFTDTARRQMVAASVTSQDWQDVVAERPAPYFFVAEGVLVYLPEAEAMGALSSLAQRFPGALAALDTYPRRTFEQQSRMSAKRGIAPWQWACDDPRSLERLGLSVVETTAITKPPAALRARLPARYRLLLPLAHPLVKDALALTLFRAGS
jgi:O-methyltransferase involved in polyketide biosynthesis